MLDPAKPAEALQREIQEIWSAVAPGWRTYEPSLAAFAWPVTLRMILEARLQPGMRVLDVGSGTGDTALAAAMAVGPPGEVVGCDLAEAMLATARDRAECYQLDNVTFHTVAMEAITLEAVAGAHVQPVASGDVDAPEPRFDAILGRFSLIFCPDVPRALAHLRGLLRPGGRIVMAAWAPPAVNPAFAIPSQALRAVIDAPAADPDAPGPFRLAGDGQLAAVFGEAGLTDIRVVDVPCYQFGASEDAYWQMLSAMSGSFCKQYRVLSSEQQQQVKAQFLEAIRAHRIGGVLRVPALARIAAGTQP